jgi:hypothetical protein
LEFGEDGCGGFCPDERFGGLVVLADVVGDGGFEVGNGLEYAALGGVCG